MATCPFCRYDNVVGATRCVMCYASLLEPVIDAPKADLTQTRISLPDAKLADVPTGNKRIPTLGVNSIALYIDYDPDPLILEISNQAILGRYTPNSASQPRIDLTQYGAQERGVSRLHAIIKRTPVGFVLQDLGSSNGTWLNGVRLEPYIPVPLKSADHFQLSQIDVEIYSGDSTQ
jgi:hypothetical protein